MFIFLNKLQQISLLLSGNRFSGNRIIDNDGCKLKFKWIFTKQIIVYRHLKCWSEDSPDRMNGTVSPPINLLELNQPCLGV